jgi:ABC-type cobalamin/Fe3+-siderophores transport system ATPase subunit
MIIIGYQGIGKSTLAKAKPGYIDLESGCFWYNGDRIKDWYIYYCQIAEHLSRQGNVVFVSSHKPVREYLKSSNERTICIYPSILISDEWKKKLHDRYEDTKLTKDYKAWMNAEEMYHINISDLMMCGIPHAEIDHMDYDLEKIIVGIIKRNKDIDLHTWKLKLEVQE